MNINLELLFPVGEHPDRNPELFFDDQPAESLIYHTEAIVEPSPADITIQQHGLGKLLDTLFIYTS